jgi:hypothetical protein
LCNVTAILLDVVARSTTARAAPKHQHNILRAIVFVKLRRQTVGSVFWWGILIGAAASFAVGIVVNLSTPTFGNYFTRSKQGWVERNKLRAIAQYDFVRRFRNGTEDKYMYFVAQWGYILFGFIFVSTMLLTMMLSDTKIFLHLSAAAGAVFGLVYISWKHTNLYLWYWRMNHFEAYRDSLQTKWTDLKLV